jgi:hypothetical protein
MRRYERFSTLLTTSNRPVEDWGKLLGDVAAGECHARSVAPSWPRSQVRLSQLAYQGGDWTKFTLGTTPCPA